jgi:hypothetical protein
VTDCGPPVERAPALHAVVVTYCRPVQLGSTLAAIAAQTRPVDSIVVVDNDPIESARPVSARVEGLTYLAADDNLGPAGGIALGMREVLATAAENDVVILIDDDDPPPHPDTFERLLCALESARRQGRRCAGVALAGARYRPTRGDFVRVPDSELSTLVRVDYLGGGQCPIYVVGALRSISGSDPGLFFGLDDADMGLQLRAAGWELLVPGDLWIEMREANGRLGIATSPHTDTALAPWRQYYSSRNAVHLAKRYGTRRALLETALRGLTLTPVNRWFRQGSRSSARAAVAGTVAGLRGELGRVVDPV